ncbi:hypothetical protein ACROYT_G005634 [Oculina patagonica]
MSGPAHNESLVAQLVRAPNRYLGGQEIWGHIYDIFCITVKGEDNPRGLNGVISKSRKADCSKMCQTCLA